MDTGGCEEPGSQHIGFLQRYNLIYFQSIENELDKS